LLLVAATAYEDDVVNLAATLLGFGLSGDSDAIYTRDSLLFRVLDSLDPDDDESTELTIEIAGETSRLDETLAALAAVQVAFGAAVAVVDYTEGWDPAPETVVRARLRELIANPTSHLQILEIGETGSFKGIAKAVTGKKGRRRIIAVAAVAALILTVIVPPVGGIVGASVAVAGAANEELNAFLDDRAKRHLAAQGLNVEEEIRKFREDLNRTNEVVAELPRENLRLIDEDKLNKARIYELTLKLNGPNLAPAA
jgi:hypothetical protein